MKTLMSFPDIERLNGEYESRTLDLKERPPHTDKLVELIQSGANGVEEVFRIIIGGVEDGAGRFDVSSLRPVTYPIQPEGMGNKFANFDKYRQNVIATVRSNTNDYFEGFFEIRDVETPAGRVIVIEVARSHHRPHQNTRSQKYYVRADGETRAMTDFEVSDAITQRQQRRAGAGASSASEWVLAMSSHPHEGLAPGQQIAVKENEDGDQHVTLTGDAHVWMRLAPSTISKSWTSTQLLRLLGGAEPVLRPLRTYSPSLSWERNKRGAVVWAVDLPGIAKSATQISTNGVLYGFDGYTLGVQRLPSQSRATFPYIPSEALEKISKAALGNYLGFMQQKMKLLPPYDFAVGLSGVENYRLATGSGQLEGRMLQGTVSHSCRIDDTGPSPDVLLLPFFQAVWDACGLSRPD